MENLSLLSTDFTNIDAENFDLTLFLKNSLEEIRNSHDDDREMLKEKLIDLHLNYMPEWLSSQADYFLNNLDNEYFFELFKNNLYNYMVFFEKLNDFKCPKEVIIEVKKVDYAFMFSILSYCIDSFEELKDQNEQNIYLFKDKMSKLIYDDYNPGQQYSLYKRLYALNDESQSDKIELMNQFLSENDYMYKINFSDYYLQHEDALQDKLSKIFFLKELLEPDEDELFIKDNVEILNLYVEALEGKPRTENKQLFTKDNI